MRRGWGAEQDLADGAFAAAVRFALFAEKMSQGLDEMRQQAAADPPTGLTGKAFTDWMGNRERVRKDLERVDRALYPEGD